MEFGEVQQREAHNIVLRVFIYYYLCFYIYKYDFFLSFYLLKSFFLTSQTRRLGIFFFNVTSSI